MPELRLLLLCLGCASSFAHAVEIEAIGPGAWAALQPDERRFNDCNSLIVAAQDFVIVVDAQENADDVRAIIEFAQSEIHKPIRYLVNTHWHSDHTQGNSIYRATFGDDLIIIGHRSHLEDIANRAAPYVHERVANIRKTLPAAREQLASGVKRDGTKFSSDELAAERVRVEQAEAWADANENVQFTLPSITIEEPYAVDAGAASFTVYPLRGHTRGDLIVHFAELGLLATGDLVDEMPFSGHGYPEEWIGALQAIDALPAGTLLPGHGKLLHDRTLLKKLDSYFTSLTSQVTALVAEGKDLQTVQAEVDLSESRHLLAGEDATAGRFFDQVQMDAIQRSFAEATHTIE